MTASRKALIVLAALAALWLGVPLSGAVSTASAQVQVLGAEPGTASQGTLALDVKITGSGFQRRAVTKFYVHDTTNPGGVKVNSTRYVNSATLIANIDVAPDAAVDLKFDIVVALADGRTGKGTEMFTVLKRVDPCVVPDPAPTPSAYVTDQPGYAGYLDGTFGSGSGRVVGPRYLQARAAAVDAQGRIVVVGPSEDACASNSKSVWAVARYLPTGALDPTFGPNGGGVVTMAFWVNSAAEAVAIQPDGKILVAGGSPAATRGNADYRPTIARYNADGSLDTGFGTGGIVLIPGTSWGVFRAIAVQGDGKIVAVGESDWAYALVVRLLPGGTWDGTFGTNGQRLLNTQGYCFARSLGVTVQTIGFEQYILLGGQVSPTCGDRHYRFALWRLDSSGALDFDFGSSGAVVTNFEFLDSDGLVKQSYSDSFHGLAVDSGNNIVVAGSLLKTSSYDYAQGALARYDVNGALDLGFGDGGKVLLPQPLAGGDFAVAVAIQPDGPIVVGGWPATSRETPVSIVWRLDASGNLDLSFGGSGRVEHSIANGASLVAADAMVLQPDGKIISAGQIIVPGTPDLRFAFVSRMWQ